MIIKIKVRNGNKPIEEGSGCIIVYTKEPRENNRANYDVIKQLSKHYGTANKNIRILKGEKSREKIIEIL